MPAGRHDSVLELGAGGGVLTRLAARRFVHERYLAVDIAPRMLSFIAGESRSAIAGVVADGEQLPFIPGSFDLLLSSSTMQWYSRPECSIPENIRLLRAGGCFSLSIFVRGSLAELDAASAATGFGSILEMRDARFYVDLLAAMPDVRFQWGVDQYVSEHESVRTFLEAHRATGATATARTTPARPKAYRDFVRFYESEFTRGSGVYSTSVVLHLWGERL